MLQLQKASRKKSFLRLNLSAPSGAGKTFSALRMAKGLIGDWSKIAVIDTENGSAGLYSHLGEFNTLDLTAPFTPERYIESIDACIKAGIECIILDSSSHEWSGQGGCIEINEALAQSKFKGNTWSAWSQTTPRHDKFVQKVLQAHCHIITCTRSKTETVMTDGKVKKLGMKDIQREGWEYELTVSLNIDRDTHTATASKDRTNLFEGKDPFVITEETGVLIKNWCEQGVDSAKAVNDAKGLLNGCKTLQELQVAFLSLDKEIAKEVVEVKNQMKAKLTPPAQATAEQPTILVLHTDNPLPNDFKHTDL